MIKAYASCFASYLLRELKEITNLNKIILFGSAARGEAGKDSDVDIFIDVKKKNKEFEKKIIKLTESFYKSREAVIFKLKGIDNKINSIIGKLEEWADLRESIESTGIVLYGAYTSSEIHGSKKVIIFWDGIKNNRGAFLNKLYGFKSGDTRYAGVIEKLKGVKLGKSSIMIPIEHRKEIEVLLKKYGVNARIIEVYS